MEVQVVGSSVKGEAQVKGWVNGREVEAQGEVGSVGCVSGGGRWRPRWDAGSLGGRWRSRWEAGSGSAGEVEGSPGRRKLIEREGRPRWGAGSVGGRWRPRWEDGSGSVGEVEGSLGRRQLGERKGRPPGGRLSQWFYP